jgi:hypothetical protein
MKTQTDFPTGTRVMVKLLSFDPAVGAYVWGNQDSLMPRNVRVLLDEDAARAFGQQVTSVRFDQITQCPAPCPHCGGFHVRGDGPAGQRCEHPDD